MGVFHISGDVLVVRIPELPVGTDLANEDLFPYWDASTNTTEHTSLATLRTFIETGSGGTLDPVYSGGSILYIVPPADQGNVSKTIPAIAGLEFKLVRDGYPMKPVDEFLRLDAGGFQLVGTTLLEGQRFELDIFELFNGTIPPASGVSTAGFIVGNKIVNTNETISVSDLNKVFQLRGASTALTVILPDVAMCPVNSFVIIETLINNTKQHRITTTGGQFLYINDTSETELFIGKGEYVWCYRTDDGWFVIVDKGNFSNLGIPIAAYKAGLNQVQLSGQLLSRTEYPRLWAFVQTLGPSLVSDGTWMTSTVTVEGRTVNNPYRGCFSTGDGTTNFRIPDYSGMSVRGLKSSDSTRSFNNAGGYQRHEYEAHNHLIWGQDNNANPAGASSPEVANIENAPAGNVPSAPAYYARLSGLSGGTETRMDNIGLNWYINY